MVPKDLATLRGDFRPDRGGVLDPKQPNTAAFASDLAEMLGLARGATAVAITSTVEGLTIR